MLRTRKIVKITDTTASNFGQYVGIYGQGSSEFIYGADALAQILTHQILTIRGEFTNQVNFGVDWFTKATPTRLKSIYDSQIKQLLMDNPYVNTIMSFDSNYVSATNTYTVELSVDTTEGLLQISI